MKRLEPAGVLVEKVLKSYPDYGKAPLGYTTSLIETFAEYPLDIQEQLADRTRGIQSRCEFLPTVAAVVKLADELLTEKARKSDLGKRFTGKRVKYRYEDERPRFIPFKKLFEDLQDEPTLFDGIDFNTWQDAAKIHWANGAKAAREFLKTSNRSNLSVRYGIRHH